jgi:O-succinylhomoserine sulfhydrylase
LELTFVDPDKVDAWKAALRDETKLLYGETIGNPGGNVLDLSTVASVAHGHGVPLMVDNTFATPYLCRPIEFGADIVVHSATKYIDGQGRSLGGAVLGSKEFIIDKLQPITRNTGPSMSPFNAWVLVKSLETLGLRMDRHCANAARVADELAGHPAIARALHGAQ